MLNMASVLILLLHWQFSTMVLMMMLGVLFRRSTTCNHNNSWWLMSIILLSLQFDQRFINKIIFAAIHIIYIRRTLKYPRANLTHVLSIWNHDRAWLALRLMVFIEALRKVWETLFEIILENFRMLAYLLILLVLTRLRI